MIAEWAGQGTVQKFEKRSLHLREFLDGIRGNVNAGWIGFGGFLALGGVESDIILSVGTSGISLSYHR
jgi:hypothetical protein